MKTIHQTIAITSLLFACVAASAQTTDKTSQGAKPTFERPAQVATPAEQAESASGQSAAAARSPEPPFKPLTPKAQKRLEQLLDHWGSRSEKVRTYSCRFERYEYDPVFGPKHTPKTKSVGILRYAAPDKGEFHVLRQGEHQPPTEPGKPTTYPLKESPTAEHWICDGESVYELNGAKKQLIQQQLPPEIRGRQIADGPLPFMFGATKEKLLTRYWMREIMPPKDSKGEYWFEAYPKRRDDAANFKVVTIILDEKSYLPSALQILGPNYDPKTNPSRTVYRFKDRRVNDLSHRAQQFLKQFISPSVPPGWKKVVLNYGQPAPSGQEAPATARRTGLGQARNALPQHSR